MIRPRGGLYKTCAALVALIAIHGVAMAAPDQSGSFVVTRKNLANAATFTVTQTLAPKGGTKFIRVYKIAVKGDNARADFDDPQAGSVRYVANNKGVFSYLPDTQTAVKQTVKGGVEQALQLVFAQVWTQMKGAKRTGTAVVAGQHAGIYRSTDGAATVFWGEGAGFRLPLRVVQSNVGGTTTMEVSGIRLNPPIPDSEFALPPGTKIMDGSEGSSSAAGTK